MRNYYISERDLWTNEDVCPAKPVPTFAGRALDVTPCRTIFEVKSGRITSHDHDGLTKKG
jgi:hypothetical protein